MNADEKLGQDPPSRLRQSEESDEDVSGNRLQHEEERGAQAPERFSRNSDDNDDVEGNRLKV